MEAGREVRRSAGDAKLIWTHVDDPRPVNAFHWFRTVVELDEPPQDCTVLFAANPTAQLWVNGARILRKVTRFVESDIRYESVNVAAHLRPGRNTVVVLHHSWGPITTFQRTGLSQAGFRLSGEWVVSDAAWRWRHADEFAPVDQQVVGLLGPEHTRIRFPIDWDSRASVDADAYSDPRYDDSGWSAAVVVEGPDSATPDPPTVETLPQRESEQFPLSLVAAGHASYRGGLEEPLDRSQRVPDPGLTAAFELLADATSAVRIDGRAGETVYATFDFGRPVHGYPVWTATAGADATLRLGYGEIAYSMRDGSAHIDDAGWVNTSGVVGYGYEDRVRLAAERRRYELPDERTARWLTIEIAFAETGTVELERLGIVTSQYPVAPIGTFVCGDPRVEQIVALGLIHAAVTMTDAYVDTPGREDGQWIEDARPRALLAERWFGDISLRRVLVREIALGQRADGSFHPFYPSNFPADAPQWDWSLQWVGMLHDDFRWTADAEFAARHFETLTRFWDGLLQTVDSDGIWRATSDRGFVLGDLRTSEEPRLGESSGVITPWLVDRLRDSAELATAVGEDALASTWDASAARIADAFRLRHVHPLADGTPVVPDVLARDGAARGLTQAGQIPALLDGLIDGEDAQRAIDFAFPAPDATPPAGVARWNNPTWSYRVLRMLSRHGHTERAVRHLRERFLPYLPASRRNPTAPGFVGPYGGPLPEYWVSSEDIGAEPGEINGFQPLDPTGSHGWAAVPLLWMHDSLLGVTIVSPGGDELMIAPESGGLPFVGGYTNTPHGVVYVYFDPQSLRLEVTVPDGATARLLFPSACRGVVMRHCATGHEEGGEHAVVLTGGNHVFEPARPTWSRSTDANEASSRT
jgi:Bacterial alpha-L-rhamnosidase 6 hairpin glycosidase domain